MSSKYQQLISTPDEVIANTIRECGSMMGTLRKVGFPRGDGRARKYIQAVAGRTNTEHCLKAYLETRTPYTTEDVRRAVIQSLCISDVLRVLGLSNHGNNFKTIQKVIDREHISTHHFDVATAKQRNKRVYTNEEIFCEHSTYSRSSLSRVVRKRGLLAYKCGGCGNEGEWLGHPLPLVIDHINGVNDDNRVENLRYLCYNCHALTDTFAGKNKR